MIERVHEHLLGELKQNTRTDTVFVLTAILLNLMVLGVNSAVGSMDGMTPVSELDLSEGNHTLYVEVREHDGGWFPVGGRTVTIDYSQPPRVEGIRSEETGTNGGWMWHIPSGSIDVRYRLDDGGYEGWAVTPQESSTQAIQTSVMFIFILVSLVVNFAVIFGLMKGKRMRLVLLAGLLRMYKDKEVEAYYDQSMLASYSVRYHVFVFVIVFLGLVSIAVPLLIRYL